MCHWYLSGSSPFGTWITDVNNPVVYGGELWSQICAGPNKHCTTGTVDEGTPDIIAKIAGFYYVTFHGYDYTTKRSARGIAKTPDFYHWVVESYDLPDDAIFSSTDCNKWNISWAPGGCVGGGEGSIMRSGDYWYELIEAPDISLQCLTQEGVQNWVLGFMRAPLLSYTSGEWDVFYIDPTIVPWEKYGCALQYHRIFSDPHGIYLSYWINDFATNQTQMQIYQLVPGYAKLPIVASIRQFKNGPIWTK